MFEIDFHIIGYGYSQTCYDLDNCNKEQAIKYIAKMCGEKPSQIELIGDFRKQ